MKKRILLFATLVAIIIFYAINNQKFVNIIIACVFAGDHLTLSAYILNLHHFLITPFALFFAYIIGAIMPTFNKAILYKSCLDLYGEIAGVPIALLFEVLVASIYFCIFRFFFARLFARHAVGQAFVSRLYRFIHNNGFSTTLYMRLQPWFPSELATLISASCKVKYYEFLRASLWGKAALILSKALLDNYRLFFIGTPRTIFRLLTISVVITVVFIYRYHKKYRKDIFDEKI
ncbi:MAG: VTT domain-containing protein [Negativicutes bacterium]|jgi:uncharacterized membrane protein YdjX (TVP38/TMEM64 family)